MMVTVQGDAPRRAVRSPSSTAIFEAKIVDVGYDAMTIMVAGEPDKLDAFSDLVKPFGIVELQRTGRIALPRAVAASPPGCGRSRPPAADRSLRHYSPRFPTRGATPMPATVYYDNDADTG